MYRYGNPGRGHSRNNQTFLYLALLVLLIVCVALTVYYFQTRSIIDNTRAVLISKLQSEVSSAKTSATRLSQTSGSKIESMVATVRQHVYAARVLNEMCTSIYGAGNVLVQDSLINVCIAHLDKCDSDIQTGAVLTATYTNLRIAIDELYEKTALLN